MDGDQFCRCKTGKGPDLGFPCQCAAKRLVAHRFAKQIAADSLRHRAYRFLLRTKFYFRPAH